MIVKDIQLLTDVNFQHLLQYGIILAWSKNWQINKRTYFRKLS